jgi:N-acyl-D-aspartate/D-glutamate deacylase
MSGQLFDFVIRRGLLVDGTGGEPFTADLAIRGGHIAAIGDIRGSGRDEFDATGLLVTPGFVDIHTHYDAQVTWSDRLTPSSIHGVTTAIMGNCGVGFAPCRPQDRETLIRLMEGIEDIPEVVLAEGLPWTWSTFPEYLDFLGARHYDIDFGGFMPHAALRVFVMGQRACNCEFATAADIVQMARILRAAIEAGAFGLATSRTVFHRSSDGMPIPTLRAKYDELAALARVLNDAGRGVVQCAMDLEDADHLFEQIVATIQGLEVPLYFSLAQFANAPDHWRELMRRTSIANAQGMNVKAQVFPRGVGFILGYEMTLNPFVLTPTYQSVAALPFSERISALRNMSIRGKILTEQSAFDAKRPLAVMVRDFERMFVLGDPVDYEPAPEDSIASRARRAGVRPEELAYDLMLEGHGRNLLYLIVTNYAKMSLDDAMLMMRHEYALIGLGDAGAHCGTICDGAYPTFMLSHWGRDRQRGEKLPLPWLIKSMTHDTAIAAGLNDRGVLATGYRADINVIDFAGLRLHAPTVESDLPKGGRRLMQRADGYRMTMVNGVAIQRDGNATGSLPGRLVRCTMRRSTIELPPMRTAPI